MINIKNKTCIHPNCKTIPNYNLEGQIKGIYCSVHKEANMIDVIHKTCIHPNCKKQPTFNLEGETKGIYCLVHKEANMVDVKNKTCKTHLCFTHVREKYNGYCIYCYINLFPEQPVSRNYKTKEKTVVDFILQSFPSFTWITDKRIQFGCSKRRPDLLLDLGYQVVIIEVDENQHITYDSSCENKRIMEISKDISHRPIIFIRFNPDGFNSLGGSINIKNLLSSPFCFDKGNITSCWGLNKLGLSIIKKSKKQEWENRLQLLKKEVEYWSDLVNKTNKTIEIVELFYDEY